MERNKQMIEEKYIEYFCKAMNIKKDAINEIFVNPGRSANNSNFVFNVNNEFYLFRIPGQGTDLFVNREKEALSYLIIKKYNISDEVYYLSPDSGIKISRYYVSSRIPNSDDDKELFGCMQSIRKLHELNIDFGEVDTLFQRAKRYQSFALEAGAEPYFLEGFFEKYEQMMNYESVLYDQDFKSVPIHGDASINNFLITKEFEHPILIDMEFPSMGHPFEDIATFCVDADYRESMILKMLDFYLNREATQFEKKMTLVLATVAAMMWYSWAAYKSAVEVNNQQFIDFRNDYESYINDLLSVIENYQ